MAGPGGGPPRRSHTKSRKGCDVCKRRHIRCDETWPQCRNCTKHKMRCPYNDMPPVDERSASPDKWEGLRWSSAVDQAIAQFCATKVWPFPTQHAQLAPDPQSLNADELRLLYYLGNDSNRMMLAGCNEFTVWTRHIPTIIHIAAEHRYVLHALLAFSAYHMTFYGASPTVEAMMLHHRGIALKGLHDAIDRYSGVTSDAILAASLALCWQATDWPSWLRHSQGTASVITAIQRDGWHSQSLFKDFICETGTWSAQKPYQPSWSDLVEVDTAFQQLESVEALFNSVGYDTTHLGDLMAFVKDMRVKATCNLPVEAQFEYLQLLRKWVLCLPVSSIAESGGSPYALLEIAYFYAVALLAERIFPDVGMGDFVRLTLAPVDAIYQRLLVIQHTKEFQGEDPAVMTPVVALAEFPYRLVVVFRYRMGLLADAEPELPPVPATHFFTPTDSPVLEMPPTTTGEFHAYRETPAFSLSSEDLSASFGSMSVLSPNPVALSPNAGGDSGPSSAVSPTQLSSYSKPQWLNIPSPSYGGQSPASSTYTDFDTASVGMYSDQEDFGVTYDASFPAVTHNPLLGDGHSNYGVGTSASASASAALLSTTPTYLPHGAAGPSFIAAPHHQHPQQPASASASPFLDVGPFALPPQPESPVPTLSSSPMPPQLQPPASSTPPLPTTKLDKGKGRAV